MTKETRESIIDYLCISALAAGLGLTIINIVKVVRS